MQVGMTIDDMRYELMGITKITPDTPDEHVELLYMLWQAAIDPERPKWSRRECELWFEYAASGNDSRHFDYEGMRNALHRKPDFDGDEMGRFDEDNQI